MQLVLSVYVIYLSLVAFEIFKNAVIVDRFLRSANLPTTGAILSLHGFRVSYIRVIWHSARFCSMLICKGQWIILNIANVSISLTPTTKMTTKIQVFFVLSLFYSKVTDLRIEGENLQLRQFFLCISISYRERLFSSHSRWKRKRHVQNVDIKTPVKGYLKNCVIFLIETTFRGLIELPNNIAIELHFLWKNAEL